jgi:hypothetical protein
MAIPTGATRVRLKIAPQRGQVPALAEIIAPHAGHEVILLMTLPRFSRNHPALSPRPPTAGIAKLAFANLRITSE